MKALKYFVGGSNGYSIDDILNRLNNLKPGGLCTCGRWHCLIGLLEARRLGQASPCMPVDGGVTHQNCTTFYIWALVSTVSPTSSIAINLFFDSSIIDVYAVCRRVMNVDISLLRYPPSLTLMNGLRRTLASASCPHLCRLGRRKRRRLRRDPLMQGGGAPRRFET